MKPRRPDTFPPSIHGPDRARAALRLLDRSERLVHDMHAAHRRELEGSAESGHFPGGLDQLGVEADITSVTEALEELINSCHRVLGEESESIDEP